MCSSDLAQALLPRARRLDRALAGLVGVSAAFLASFVGQLLGGFRAGERLAWGSAALGAVLLVLLVAGLQAPDDPA